MADGVKRLPAGRTNPLVVWRLAYGERTRTASRPTVATSGTFRGNAWPRPVAQYTRKTDGVTVPYEGGVPRLRKGIVTRASGTGIRKGLSKKQRAAGFGVVTKGQVIGTGRNVLGKLRGDGTRVRGGDPQLYKTTGDTLLGTWTRTPPKLENDNKRATITTSKPYAARVHRKRPFAWGTEIARVEMDSLNQLCARYLFELLRRER